MKHKHWAFIAFEELVDNGVNFKFPVDIEVTDFLTEQAALKEVQKIVKRQFYKLRRVWECTRCLLDDEQLRLVKEHMKRHD